MRSFFAEHLRILRAVGLPLLILLNLSALVDQSLTLRLEDVLQGSDGPGAEVWFIAAASLLNSLLFPALVSALALFGLFQSRGWTNSLPDFLGRIVNSLYIETLRAWGSALRWALLLILPGLVRLFQLAFIPLIVAAHRGYDEGRADALRTSTAYVNRRWFRLSLLMLVFQLLLPLTLTQLLDPWKSFYETPHTAVLVSLVDLVIVVLFTQLLFALFDRIRQEVGDELVFRLDGTASAGAGPHL